MFICLCFYVFTLSFYPIFLFYLFLFLLFISKYDYINIF